MKDNKPKMPSAVLDDLYVNMDFDKSVSEMANKLSGEAICKQECMIIEDIIDIYNGEYKSYQEYIDCKRAIVGMIEKKEQEHFKNLMKRAKDGCTVKYFVRPIMLSKEQFDYTQYKKVCDNTK